MEFILIIASLIFILAAGLIWGLMDERKDRRGRT